MKRPAHRSPLRSLETLEPRILLSLAGKLPVIPSPAPPPIDPPTPPIYVPRIPTFSTRVGVPIFSGMAHYSGNYTLPSEITVPTRVATGLITWNDGTETRGRLARGPHGEVVHYGDDHIYTQAGHYSGLVSLYEETIDPALGIPATPGPDAQRLGYFHIAINVGEYVPTIYPELAAGMPISAVMGISREHLVGRLNDKLLNLPGEVGATTFLAVRIDWGDGKRSDARLVRNAQGGIDIFGTHTYSKPRTFTVGAVGRLVGGSGASAPVGLFQVPATVTANSPTALAIRGTAGVPAGGVLATIPRPEGYKLAPAAAGVVVHATTSQALHATVHWGDGTHSPALFRSQGQSAYQLLASHTYLRPGTFRLTLIVQESTPYGPIGAHHMQARAYQTIHTLYGTASIARYTGKLPVLMRFS